MNEKKVLTHLIRAGRDAQNLENILATLGYKETPYFNLYGDISEAVYTLLNEDTESFDESITCAVMNDPLTPDDVCAEQLATMVSADMDIPDSTLEILEEAAADRNVDLPTMIRLILCEWAVKETYAKRYLV